MSARVRVFTGAQAEAQLSGRRGTSVRCCETPEFFALHGCPHEQTATDDEPSEEAAR
jgi:hypothetical protein